MNMIEKLQRAWERRGSQTPSQGLTFASALWHVPPPHTSHDTVLDLLPEFIDAEMEHRTNSPKFLVLKRHLLVCPSCATTYFDLLETARLDAAHKFLPSATMPRAALDFLKSQDIGE